MKMRHKTPKNLHDMLITIRNLASPNSFFFIGLFLLLFHYAIMATPFETFQWFKNGKIVQQQMCAWVVARLPQSLKSMFLKIYSTLQSPHATMEPCIPFALFLHFNAMWTSVLKLHLQSHQLLTRKNFDWQFLSRTTKIHFYSYFIWFWRWYKNWIYFLCTKKIIWHIFWRLAFIFILNIHPHVKA